jgi:hypothetical protein
MLGLLKHHRVSSMHSITPIYLSDAPDYASLKDACHACHAC